MALFTRVILFQQSTFSTPDRDDSKAFENNRHCTDILFIAIKAVFILILVGNHFAFQKISAKVQQFILKLNNFMIDMIIENS